MRADLFLAVQAVLCILMMWSCFCRLTKTDRNTHREIRWAFLFEGACAGVVFGAPFLPLLMPGQVHWKAGTTPTGAWIVLLLSVWLVQVVTARYWREGVPQAFQRSTSTPGRSALPAVGFAAVALAVGLMLAGPQLVVAKAAADAPPEAQPKLPFHVVPYGRSGTCVAPEGCAAMALKDLQVLLDSAENYGAAVACGRKPTRL